MTKEQIIFQISKLYATIGAIQAKLIEKEILDLSEINSFVKSSLIIGKEALTSVSDEEVDFESLSRLFSEEISKLG